MHFTRKGLLLILSIFLCASLFGYSYQITDIDYDITGKTKENALPRNVEINTKTVFPDEESFLAYIETLKREFSNTRAFDEIEIDYSINGSDDSYATDEEIEPEEDDNDEIKQVTLYIKLKDSLHFLAVPYIKYSTSDGLSLKVKIKDTNFLGTMNTLSSSLDWNWKPDEDGNKFRVIEPELNFEYDLPFSIGKQNFTWLNNYSISCEWGAETPEWDAETGIAWTHSLGKKNAKINVSFIQGFYRNLDYNYYGDDTYFSEKINISVPMIMFDIKNYGSVKFTPTVRMNYSFDPFYPNGYSGLGYTTNPDWKADNIDLMGPKIYFDGFFVFNNVNWAGNFRNGVSFSLGSSVSFNFASLADKDIFRYSLGIEAKGAAYKSFKYIGFYTRFVSFAYVNVEKKRIAGAKRIDTYLRGIIDGRKVDSSTTGTLRYNQSETPVAIVFNFDMPIHIFTTDWENFPITRKIPFMRYFNFELQLSPFADFALIQTTPERHGIRTRTFNLKDGFYTAGLEAIVFPIKWKSLEVRASAGFDLGMLLVGSVMETSWRNKHDLDTNWLKTAEISIGLGLHY